MNWTADYATQIDTLITRTRAREAALGLRDSTCYSRFFLHPAPTAKVILFFHGFTAVPEQFVPIAQALFQDGYNVLIPLLPGHGQAGDWDRSTPPPLPENELIYQEFGLNWLEQAASLGDAVVVGGLSGGSTLAAWLALESPQTIDRALLFAPYLSNSKRLLDWFVDRLNVYFEWQSGPDVATFGYKGFAVPALRVFLEMGKEVLKRAETNLAAPLLIVSSENDQAVGIQEHQDLFQSALRFQPRCWYYYFDRELNVPHNMMTQAEGNPYADRVIELAKAYLNSDLVWSEVQAVRELVQQGYEFDQAIARLNLEPRAASNLAAFVSSLQVPSSSAESNRNE
ncbi:alpha/beta fold hydrolase [Leptolyngbya sp. FACHB-36]|uniref:alpha/beta hydrolase n=1 Tax=Leptolyngbya sp. FACHB-36 TaxID=2692808 RepID=UPI00167FF093|nr:alpha/beta fold hydrolase [Leptolyngbya sp. FACHB-36]MBD2020232.1 alpha/beta fold hydrolase [Leptolyngbya sp. FACHB-36]